MRTRNSLMFAYTNVTVYQKKKRKIISPVNRAILSIIDLNELAKPTRVIVVHCFGIAECLLEMKTQA